ncbi:glycosyltransferase [Pedobacter sp. WC2423]|uniref:glycosyltransferase n=1 Tax=Pedobacter sp. WC2423 TaxID=3234142 RepID=UPI003464F371
MKESPSDQQAKVDKYAGPGSDILLLETYPAHELPYDGLSGFFNVVKNIGTIIKDTKHTSGAKVLVCGIAPFYEDRLSVQNTNIIFTTFESDEVPLHWVESINRYHHCIVPHEAIKVKFESSGVITPISVIHQGYYRYKRGQMLKKKPKEFNVGFLGIPVNRKNMLKLYDACKQLQASAIPEIKLHVHVSYFYDWLDTTPFKRIQSDEMIVWTSGNLSAEEVSDWYYKLSCYVFPSSGEGWSYTPRESMYLGIPTIITDIPVHKELIDSGFCKVIRTSGIEPADFNGATHGFWAKVEANEIKTSILDVYNRYDYFHTQALSGAAWIENEWFNENVVTRLKDLIVDL